MKMTIQKSFTFEVDTGKERKRIKECWKPTQPTYKKLMELMDLVEAEEWDEAYAELESKWWNGRDKKQECPRLEFVGMLNSKDLDSSWDTYSELIWKMFHYPEMYKVISVEDR